jgi:alpha-D-xyloside xylohydrolase
VRLSANPFAITVADSHGRVAELGGKQAPFVYWTATGVEHAATRVLRQVAHGATTTYTVATDEPGRNAVVSVRPGSNEVRIDYAIEPRADVAAIGFSMSASPAAHFLGSGQRDRWVDMSRTVQPLKVFNTCRSSSPSPFFASTAGFGAWVSSTAVGRIAFPGASDDTSFACDLGTAPCSVGPPANAVRWCFKSGAARATVAFGSLRQILTAHARAVGLPRKPWLPQFALIKWRDQVPGPQTLYNDVAQLRKLDIPVGWVLLDNPWEQGTAISGCFGSLTFDTTKYPDPKGMIDRIHDQGVRFMLWISPQIPRRNCPAPNYPDGWLTGDDQTFVRDLTLAPVRADFVQRLKRLVALGVDGFKGDRGDEVNLEPDQLAGGPGVREQNAYPLLYAKAAAAAFAPSRGSNFASLFRSFVPGSSAVLPGFVGPDAEQSFTGLDGEIRSAQNAGIAGAPVWGSDIGGYAGGTLTSDLFVRWAQFAALTPIFEVGGAGRNATFWQLGPAAVRGFRAAATLHYELVPYLYSLARSASATGIPVVRPLGLTWPMDSRAWSADLEFTVGAAVLASPVDSPDATRRVYLPAGHWIDLFSGGVVQGGRVIARHNGPDDFPLYLRSGTAIPDAFRKPVIWRADWKPNDLLRPGRQGWLVAPAAHTTIRSVADRGATLSAVVGDHDKVDITVGHALREEQFLIYAPHPACRASVAGRQLRRFSVSSLRAARSGWAIWHGATVVKVSAAPATLHLSILQCT